MIREAVITPKNENSGLKKTRTSILQQFLPMERKNHVPDFF